MDPARLVITFLIAAAFALPFYGALRAYCHARRVIAQADARAVRFVELNDERRAAERAVDPEPADTRAERLAAVRSQYRALEDAEGFPSTSINNIGLDGYVAASHAVRDIFDGNRANAVIIAIGLACGAAAALWALYLPAAGV
ncbi:hypothetical protein GCM10022200_05410 [Microbacterium awajiense]|uniref:Uncharacterized protein n=1 Tax=Microbacterium awajiense TaxID=415214 RepID=A0ABP7A6Q4_9MICO